MDSEELYTRCPTCKTVYRTHEAQLSIQSGKVRCGHCRMIFDGRAHLVDLAPESQSSREDETTYGPPTVTLRESVALEAESEASRDTPPAVTPDGKRTDEAPVSPSAPEHPVHEALAPLDDPDAVQQHAAAAIAESSPEPREEEVVPYEWHETPPPPPRRGLQWVFGIASVLLVLLLAGQALFQFRHVLAANYPQFRPNLVAACAIVGCTVEALRSRDEITIESHDLQADPAHQGLLILQVTLRNRASHAVAFPYLELEILDLGGQPQVRRAFAPVEYAGGAADFTRGMPAGAEWNVKLFIDASSVTARGYNLDLFYP